MVWRIHEALERWRAAERELAELADDSLDRADAEAAVAAAREAYLEVVRVVALEQGATAMPDLSETQMYQVRRPETTEGDNG